MWNGTAAELESDADDDERETEQRPSGWD